MRHLTDCCFVCVSSFNEVSELKELGKGSYSLVSRCMWKGKDACVKQVYVIYFHTNQ